MDGPMATASRAALRADMTERTSDTRLAAVGRGLMQVGVQLDREAPATSRLASDTSKLLGCQLIDRGVRHLRHSEEEALGGASNILG